MAQQRPKNAGDTAKNARKPTRGAAERPAQPTSNDQSGSAGRRAVDSEQGPGADTGQGRYGQSGFAGGEHQETAGQSKYRRSESAGDAKSKARSNRGSGRADPEESRGKKP